MPNEPAETVHASAVLVGARAVLIRGASGAGKSTLAWRLLGAGLQSPLPFARLVGDDRVRLLAAHGRLLVRPAPPLAGLIEVRGLGIRALPFEPVAVVGRIVDLGSPQAERMPLPGEQALLCGVSVPRFAFPSGTDALPVLLAALFGSGP